MTDYMLGQPEPPRARLGARFGVFGLVVVLVVGLLSTRLFYLQVVNGGYYIGLANNRQSSQLSIPAARGLIYDRAGRPVAINIPTYVVRVRPGDLPFPERDAVVARLSTLLNVPSTDIIEALDSYAGQRFEYVEIANDVPSDVARIIDEEGRDLPGVDVIVEERREYEYGAVAVARAGLHRPSDVAGSRRAGRRRIPQRRPDRQDGRRGDIRERAARHLRLGAGRARFGRPDRAHGPD